MNSKTKIIILCGLVAIPPFILPIPPLLIEKQFPLFFIQAVSVLAIAIKFSMIIAIVQIALFFNIALKKKNYLWGFLFPQLVFLLLIIPAWKLSNNIEAQLYLNITKASQKIIVKVDTWTKETGHPPSALKELLPIHLKKIPTQPYEFFGEFHYVVNDDIPMLYVEIPNPPFEKQYLIYTFKHPHQIKAIASYLDWQLTYEIKN